MSLDPMIFKTQIYMKNYHVIVINKNVNIEKVSIKSLTFILVEAILLKAACQSGSLRTIKNRGFKSFTL